MRKLILLALALTLVGATLIALLYLGRNALTANPPIQFSDGSSLRLLEVTLGTNHIHGSVAAKLLNHLPQGLKQPLLKHLPNGGRLNTRRTSEPTLILWMEYSGPVGGSSSSRRAMLRPVGGVLSGNDDYLSLQIPPGATTSTVSAEFGAWPRRSQYLECAILEQGPDYEFTEIGSFRFRNHDVFAGGDWTPESLPATNSAGDLQVTLLDFVTGMGNETRIYGPDGSWRRVFQMNGTPETMGFVQVKFDSPRGTNETWIMFNADLSDATGNRQNASSRSGMTSDMTFDPILWPDETAWKLRLHLKRKAGFEPEELVEFTNVAIPEVGKTDLINWTNSAMGIEIVLKSFIHRPELTDRSGYSSRDLSQLRIEHPQLGQTNQLDLVSMVVWPAGTNLNSGGSSWSDDYHEFNLSQIPPDATHLDLTFSVQPTRYVEFIVAPNLVTNDYVLEQD